MIKRRPKHSKKNESFHFVATCGAGLENLVKEEIISFGGNDPKTTPGAVSWQATNLQSAYRACLWSRFASRILLQLATFTAKDPEDIYREAGNIDWSRHFSGDTTFAAYCTLVKTDPKLNHSHYASLKIKDAIVDQFRKRTGKRPDIDVRKPGIRINLHVQKTEATLALDISGDSLHRRGYRSCAGEAPLKESLAASIVHLSGIDHNFSPEHCILDPMCGSATLLIEAALIYGNSAPGLQRKEFGFMYWNLHNEKMWEKLVAEAIEREDARTEIPWPPIIGYDADPKVVAVARKNIINAGLQDKIIVKQRQLARLQPPAGKGILVTNPPYGERLSEKESVKYLYRCFGRIFRSSFAGWKLGFFTANPDLADMLGVSWQDRRRLYNGPIKCRLLCTVSPGIDERATEMHQWELHKPSPELAAQDFANRLFKNCQRLLPWAKEQQITCFRLYDADLPDYNLAIDLYEQWVHVLEYPRPTSVNNDKAQQRFDDALQAIRQLLDVPHSDVFIKTGAKQLPPQKQKKATRAKLYEVHENEARYLADFTHSRDTGVSLHKRTIRKLIAELIQGRTFLHLFAGTSTATVQAAAYGATSTLSIDHSEPLLVRAKANLSLNGYGGSLHRYKGGNSLQWLKSGRERYGVILIDAPGTIRHKTMEFDVQADHEELLRLAMIRLAPEGVLLFCTQTKKFEIAPSLAADFPVENITEQIIPFDFSRSKQGIHCYRLRHKEEKTDNDL
jgi:23S rRNA (guanine2445-N2)-methyltransferase / 23S rRNA (guanine2069-N7)-methyltransferase